MKNTITKTETVPVGDLKIHPDNARRGNVAAIAESLRAHGQFRPIVVQQSTGYILAGNHTYRAAVDKLGWTHIEVSYVKVDDKRARAILAIDNRSSDRSGYDNDALATLLEQLQDDDLLTSAGYTTDDLDDLLAELEENADPIAGLGEDDDDEAFTDEVKDAKSLSDKADAYDAQTSRMVVLNYPIKQFSYVVMQLEGLCEEYGLENNADVVLHLLEKATGMSAPKAE
jgi:hypothetical protein